VGEPVVTHRRVTIVTAGHPSTCPRMVKAADAAVEAGCRVRFVSVDYIDWAAGFDVNVATRRRWRWTPISLQRAQHPVRSRWVSARQRAARSLATFAGASRIPHRVAVQGYARTHAEVVAAILHEPFDLVYGGTVAALAAVAEAATRARRPYGLDLEDFHLAESEDKDGWLTHALAARVVPAAAASAAFVTTASNPMSRQYERDCGVQCKTIHNVMPLPAAPVVSKSSGPLRLYWFSQTIGPGRGLEEVIDAVAVAGIAAELHLRGNGCESYLSILRDRVQALAGNLTLHVHPPASPDDMVALCRDHHVGLSPEQPSVLNRDLCVSNKVLTYLSAGLAVAATHTQGHASVGAQSPGAIALYEPGDITGLAAVLRTWHDDREALCAARRAAWHAAQTRFHWEHPHERGALIAALEGAVA
jgi:hypothetical protein